MQRLVAQNCRGSGLAALVPRAHQTAAASSPPKLEGQRPRCPCTPRASGRRGRRPSKTGGAAASLPLYPARTRPPRPAVLQKWRGSGLAALVPRALQAAAAGGPPKLEGQRPRCPCTPRASGRRGRQPSTKTGGATASLPLYPARTRPPRPADLPSRRI